MARNFVTRYAYNPLKEITEVIDARDHLTQVTYDNRGRRTVIDNLDTGKVEYAYDRAAVAYFAGIQGVYGIGGCKRLTRTPQRHFHK